MRVETLACIVLSAVSATVNAAPVEVVGREAAPSWKRTPQPGTPGGAPSWRREAEAEPERRRGAEAPSW